MLLLSSRKQRQIRFLPLDAIIPIFKHLSYKDQRSCRVVCREWNRILITYFRPNVLRLSMVLRPAGDGTISMYTMDREVWKKDLQQLPKHVEVIDIRLVGLTDSITTQSIRYLIQVFDACPNLKSCSVVHPPLKLFGLLLHPIVRQCTSLTLTKDKITPEMLGKLENCLMASKTISTISLSGFPGEQFDRIFTLIARCPNITKFRLEASWFNSCSSIQLIGFLRQFNRDPRCLEGHFDNYINDVDFNVVAQNMTMCTVEGRHIYLVAAKDSKCGGAPEYIVSFFGKTRISVMKVEDSYEFKVYFVERTMRAELINADSYVGSRLAVKAKEYSRKDGVLHVGVQMTCGVISWALYHIEKNGLDFDQVQTRVSQRLSERFQHKIFVHLKPLWEEEESTPIMKSLSSAWGRMCPRPSKVRFDEVYFYGYRTFREIQSSKFAKEIKKKRGNYFTRSYRRLRALRAEQN